MLAYGIAADAVDEFVRLSEFQARKFLDLVMDAIVWKYEKFYLRLPTLANVDSIQNYKAERGFPGQAFCIDCMHWQWKPSKNLLTDIYASK